VAVFVSLVALVALVVAPIGESMALGPEPALAAPVDDDRPTRPTINEFYPEQRPLSDCLSSLPKPNCGSDARGGWRQLAVLGAIVGGLGFIAWRIVATARRSQPDPVA
jgi:hypothetical protein